MLNKLIDKYNWNCPIASRRIKLSCCSCFFLLFAAVILTRIYFIQFKNETWIKKAKRQHYTKVKIAPERGVIFDRNGNKIAISAPTASIFVRPKLIKDKAQTANVLHSILNISFIDAMEKLNSDKNFVWIKRQAPMIKGERIDKLKIAGLGSEVEAKRFYPYGEAAARLIGKVGIDGSGLSGIESIFDKELTIDSITAKTSRNAKGKKLYSVVDKEFQIPKGQKLDLTIDTELQLIVDEEVLKAHKETNADKVTVILSDSNDGSILAVSETPFANFNKNKIKDRGVLKNSFIESVFEPGSIMKPFVAAKAIDDGFVSSNELIDCENGRYRYANKTIHDVHRSKVISFKEVLMHSSNIGMVKVADRMGKERLYKSLRDLKFGTPTDIGFPAESAGILRNYKSWAKVDIATHSFGQGVAVSSLQLIRALSVIANNGIMVEPKILKSKTVIPEKIVSKYAAKQVAEMMYDVVNHKEGTGKRAKIDNLKVYGKTGTAQKAKKDGRGYESDKYISTFIGYVDATNYGISEKLTALVVIDNAKLDKVYGGVIAAPVFRNIIKKSVHHLATKNKFEYNNSEIDEINNNSLLLRNVSYGN